VVERTLTSAVRSVKVFLHSGSQIARPWRAPPRICRAIRPRRRRDLGPLPIARRGERP
jgi:hypothetical protein